MDCVITQGGEDNVRRLDPRGVRNAVQVAKEVRIRLEDVAGKVRGSI